MPTPPPSQHGNRRDAGPRIISKWVHLAEDEITLVDDLIRKLSTYGLLGLQINNISRYHFWTRVFHAGWDTSNIVPPIADNPPARGFMDSALPIGKLAEDAVAGSPLKRNRDGTVKVTAKRKAGQPVYVRPQLQRGTFDMGVNFQYIDGDGKTVSGDVIQPDDAYTVVKAMTQVVKHFEAHESDRVNDWNCTVMVMWARQRLRVYLGLVDNMSVAAARARVASNARELEDEHRLVQLVSAVAKLADMRRTVAQLVPGEVPGWKGVVDTD